MKWLILLALIAGCGKHKEPKALDYKDNDGDQVLNYEESEFDKYIANYESIGSVKGSILFKLNEKVELKLTNGDDLESRILGTMVSNEKRIHKEEHFSEWAKLKVEQPVQLPKLNQVDYEVLVQFEKDSGDPHQVHFESKKYSYVVGEWKQNMKFRLTAENLTSLANGNAHFVLRKNSKRSPLFGMDSEESIKNKTYRLLFDDGKKTVIYYVSKELNFKGVQKILGVSARTIENEDEFFFNSKKLAEAEWIGREFANGDKVLLLADFEKLRTRFFQNYTYQKTILSRVNGISKKKMEFANRNMANVYMRIRPLEQILYVFEFQKVKRTYGEGGGGREGGASVKQTCTHHYRVIKQEQKSIPQLNVLLESNDFILNDKHAAGALEQEDERGNYFELKFISLPDNSFMKLNETPAENKVLIGEISPRCGESTGASQEIDAEGKLSFEVESFVEKIP